MAGRDGGVAQHGLVPVAIAFPKETANPIEGEGVDHQPHGQREIAFEFNFGRDGVDVAISRDKQVDLDQGDDAEQNGQLDPKQTHPNVLEDGFC